MTPNSPVGDDDAPQRLARIERLWAELKAVHKDPVKYEALVKSIRREADAFRQERGPHDGSTGQHL